MQKNTRKYPLRKEGKIILIEVPELFYKEIMRDIYKIRKANQRAGTCCCPRSKLHMCDAYCSECGFYKGSGILSLDKPVSGEDGETSLGATLPSGDISPEDVVEMEELLDKISEELSQMDDVSRAIIQGVMNGKKDREIAASLGIPQSTLSYRKLKALEILRKVLID